MSRIIDLSHVIGINAPAFPGDPSTIIDACCTIERDGVRVGRVSVGTHQGTHVDAPAHFLVSGASIDAMPLEAFYGPAQVIRIPCKPGARIYADELTPFDPLLQPGARILIATGWSSRWGAADYFEDPPVLTPDSVMLLASRGLALLGIDGPDISSNEKLAHEMLLGKGVALLENLANLEQCPDVFTLAALPLKLDGCDGSPVRAVAVVE